MKLITPCCNYPQEYNPRGFEGTFKDKSEAESFFTNKNTKCKACKTLFRIRVDYIVELPIHNIKKETKPTMAVPTMSFLPNFMLNFQIVPALHTTIG